MNDGAPAFKCDPEEELPNPEYCPECQFHCRLTEVKHCGDLCSQCLEELADRDYAMRGWL